VAYSSVIQSTLQQQQQHHQNLCWTKLEDDGAGQEDIKNVLQLQVKQEQRQLDFANEASTVDVSGGGENLVFNLPPGLEIKQTFYPAGVVDGEQLQLQEHNQNQTQSQSSGRRQHVVANMIMSPAAGNLASQIQVVPKVCMSLFYFCSYLFNLFVFCLYFGLLAYSFCFPKFSAEPNRLVLKIFFESII